MYKEACKFTLICLLLCGLDARIDAQGNEFGIRAGIQGALTESREGVIGDAFTSPYAGVFFGRLVGSTFFASVISGLEYHQNGYNIDENNLRRLHYIGIPLAIRFHFGPWHLQPGISANFKVAERLVVGGQDALSEENKSSFFDLPLQLGAGVRFMDFFLEARLYYGWMDINQGNRNVYFQLGLAYSF